MTTARPTDRAEGGGAGAADPVGLDLRSLERYFAGEIEGFAGRLRAELLHGGRSNLTYLVSDGATRWVLRRPPLGTVAPSANDVAREWRVMAALGSTDVPVPPAVALCEDERVIGCPFSVVAYVDGAVIRSAADGAALDPGDARRCAEALVRHLAGLHEIDPVVVGLGGLGRPEGYLERQVRRWRSQWEIVSTGPCADLDRLHRGLAARVGPERGTSIVHGDYRLDNTILSSHDPSVLLAVVDWEMATLGDPLADLALMLEYWDPACEPLLAEGHAPSANPGFPDGDALVELYAAASGRDVDGLAFYRALAAFKLAVIAEGIHRRYLEGLTVGEGFETTGDAVPRLVAAGLRHLTGTASS